MTKLSQLLSLLTSRRTRLVCWPTVSSVKQWSITLLGRGSDAVTAGVILRQASREPHEQKNVE